MKKAVLLGLLTYCMSVLSSPIILESRELNQDIRNLGFAKVSHEARSTSEACSYLSQYERSITDFSQKHPIDRRHADNTWSNSADDGEEERRSLNFASISHEARSTTEVSLDSSRYKVKLANRFRSTQLIGVMKMIPGPLRETQRNES